jgi:plastocyanin
MPIAPLLRLSAAVLLLTGQAHAATVQIHVTDGAGKALPGAVVYLDSSAAHAAARPLASASIEQIGKQFVPAVTVVPAGTRVSFPNRDPYRHHVYSFSPAKKFEIQLYQGTDAVPVLFDRAGIVVLGCNIHDNMVGWVIVVDTPHYGTTQAGGALDLANVPPGAYRLHVWHPGLPGDAPALELPLTVGPAGAPPAPPTTVRLAGVHS